MTWDEGEVGFEKVPGGEEYENRSVVCWHFYVPPQVSHLSLLQHLGLATCMCIHVWNINSRHNAVIVHVLWLMFECSNVINGSLQVSEAISFEERMKDVKRLNCGGRLNP